MATATTSSTATAAPGRQRYPYRLPSSPDALRAVPLADRLTFDQVQRSLWYARLARPGEWVWSIGGPDAIYGRIVCIARDRFDNPVFVVQPEEGATPRTFSYEQLDRMHDGGLLLEGDQVEVLVSGEWCARRVTKIEGPRQLPRVKVEGTRKVFYPGLDLRIPGV